MHIKSIVETRITPSEKYRIGIQAIKDIVANGNEFRIIHDRFEIKEQGMWIDNGYASLSQQAAEITMTELRDRGLACCS